MSREIWLEGPIAGVSPLLLPVAHALRQSQHDLRAATAGLSPGQVWQRPHGVASIGFHLRHIAGSMGRLFTYAMAGELSVMQRDALAIEKEVPEEPVPVDVLLAQVDDRILECLSILQSIPESSLTEARFVGRARRPSTVIGILSHAAEHTQRHTGQVITTAMVVRAG